MKSPFLVGKGPFVRERVLRHGRKDHDLAANSCSRSKKSCNWELTKRMKTGRNKCEIMVADESRLT